MKSIKYPSLAVGLLLSFVFLMTAQSVSQAKRALPLTSSLAQAQNPPKIINARMKGSKIIILGENFNHDTVVLINGRPVKTIVDSESPTSIVVAKKIHKATSMGAEVQLAVQTSNGQTSESFAFFVGPMITLDDGGKIITISVGERVLLLLKSPNHSWTPSVQDPTILQKIENPSLVQEAQAIYQALRPGSTKLMAIGELPCHKTVPPCLGPNHFFEVTINVVQ
jgi:hypothetical protein